MGKVEGGAKVQEGDEAEWRPVEGGGCPGQVGRPA
jgi:hypothetical protein